MGSKERKHFNWLLPWYGVRWGFEHRRKDLCYSNKRHRWEGATIALLNNTVCKR